MLSNFLLVYLLPFLFFFFHIIEIINLTNDSGLKFFSLAFFFTSKQIWLPCGETLATNLAMTYILFYSLKK